ncbi:MAG TPA: PepSY-associated TM helix domain-containing protein [Candidatus Eisenbacteria bacterium]|nr:PepSY-associated TM helix domain-containing protein [Candidatus Eisenbacteria bacterium]
MMGARFRSQTARRRRPLAFTLHSLLGLNVSLLLLFVCLTGTVAVVSDEIEWLASPKFRASSTSTRVGWQAQYEAAQTAYPTYHLTDISAGEEPYMATRIWATSPAGELRIIYVDPASGHVNGESSFVTFRSFMRALHYYLFTPGDWGFFLVTALGFVLLASAATGLLVYKKFWRGFFRVPATGRGSRLFWGNMHKLFALWSLWFVLLMALTSIWYFGERIVYRLGIDLESVKAPVAPKGLAASDSRSDRYLPLDALVARATEALPGLDVKSIYFPATPAAPISINGEASAWLVRDRANSVALDPRTGAVLSIRRAERMSLLERWVHTADPLHFGDFGGLWSKLTWVFFGLLLCGLAASGAAVYVKRTTIALSRIQRSPQATSLATR